MASPQPLRLLFLLAAATAAAAGGGTLFNFTSFTPNTPGVNYSGDAFASGGNIIELTRNQIGDLRESSGHAVYARPVHLWDPAAGAAVDFTTNFRFRISILNESNYGDGLAFFLAPVGYSLPPNSFGGWLGLFNSTTDGRNSTQLVAVEFDTYRNEQWDFTSNHIGIDINSVFSKRTLFYNKDSNIHSVTVSYNSTSANLSVFLSDDQSLSHNVNLTEILPHTVVIGFSGATGNSTELHQIISWDFSSTFTYGEPEKYYKKSKSWMLGVGISVVTIISGAAWLLRRRCRRSGDSEDVIDQSMEDKLVQGTGFPKKYTYKQLETATHAFGVEGKLGQGGFGAVYMGYVDGEMVAVKRISRGSSQGKKEYVSEVTVISRLRHRNLVRLTGWCHERSEFLLVYEYMENGSLDSYLFGEKKVALKWGLRYRIARGLAAALLYLHEEWEQCVVHRDVKASNVMLDAGFNARLGDFGLARMVEHGMGSQTTVLAGTMGYLAPECVISGRASKESDVYSFGVVALEIACGRRAVEPAAAREEEVRLVEWAWGMYGRGRVGEAADGRLEGEFVEGEMERMVAVGLWCAHPDSKARPTMREAIQVLMMQAPVPRLPAEVPRPMYFSPPMDAERLLLEASGSFTAATGSNSSGTTPLK